MRDRRQRMVDALWGLFVADALSMPVHWYYNRDNIRQDFDGGITTFEPARHPHPEAFMVGMTYKPDVAAAKACGREFDILHQHARFYDTSYSSIEIARDARESEHGNAAPAPEERYHYHHGLKAGENTLNAHLARVLMRSAIAEERYEPARFVDGMIDHMTLPGLNGDAYTEIFLRRWFEQYALGLPADACAEQQRRVWSIGSHGGMHRPLIVSMMAADAYQGTGFALEHQALTHRSENVASALHVAVPLLHALLNGGDAPALFRDTCSLVRLPVLKGEELFRKYRDAKGPGNIPKPEMWQLHTELSDNSFDIDAYLAMGEEAVIRKLISTACYTEHGLPLMLFLALHEELDTERVLLLNANAGGDNVNRGLTLGLLMGAASSVPKHLKRGLADHDAIEAEIEAFTDLAMTGRAF